MTNQELVEEIRGLWNNSTKLNQQIADSNAVLSQKLGTISEELWNQTRDLVSRIMKLKENLSDVADKIESGNVIQKERSLSIIGFPTDGLSKVRDLWKDSNQLVIDLSTYDAKIAQEIFRLDEEILRNRNVIERGMTELKDGITSLGLKVKHEQK